MDDSLNIFGQLLIACSLSPNTGYFRDGCCNTEKNDLGVHTVCVITTEDFLKFSKSVGNDLSTPHPQWDFPGLKAGDKWCLCASRFLEAHENGMAPYVVLEATHEKTLEIVPMDVLLKYAFRATMNK